MARIGIPRQPQDRLSFYRTYAWMVELRSMGHQVETFHPFDRASYAKCDWIFSHMLFGRGAERVVEITKQMGCKLWVDVDDNIWHVPFSNPNFEWHMNKERQHYILDKADLITVSTVPLLKMMENFLMKDNIMLLENYLWIEGVVPPRGDGKTVIAWRGGQHIEDFPMIVSELYDLEQEVDEIHYFGDRPAQYTPTGVCKVMWHPHTDTWKYLELLKQVNPLLVFGYWADIPFNSTKSDILLQEATAAGAVLVMNKGWNAFDDKPCYRYKKEELCKAVVHCKGEMDVVKQMWRDAVDLIQVKRDYRHEQIMAVSERLKRNWERIELEPYNFEVDTANSHPDVISDEEYYTSDDTFTHDGDEAYDRFKVDGV